MGGETSGRAGDTVVDTTHLVLPGEGNVHGNVFGGHVCAWLDLACAVSAMRHARRPVVTASMDDLHFHAPIRVGHVAVIRCQVNAVFRTSLEVGAEVWAEDPLTGERRRATSAFLTFVALDASGRAVPLPRLVCETEAERVREAQAQARRAARLERRRLPPTEP
jgi:acyl-CoA hydrolase